MNLTEQRIAICLHVQNVSPLWRHVLTEGKKLGGAAYASQQELFLLQMPDYPNDLNAMFSAEKTLTAPQQREYYRQCLAFGRTQFDILHLSAEQRSTAFVKTIGKWTSKPVKGKEVCPRCGAIGYHNCTKMAGQKSPHGPLPMVDHSAGWPYTDPNIPCDI